jgi:hypothetical protein
MPLDYFMHDSQPGDTIGQGKDGVWFVASTSGIARAAPSIPLLASSPSPSGVGPATERGRGRQVMTGTRSRCGLLSRMSIALSSWIDQLTAVQAGSGARRPSLP